MGHVTYQSLLVADVDLIIYGILMYLEYCIIRGVRNKKSINKRAVILCFSDKSGSYIECNNKAHYG